MSWAKRQAWKLRLAARWSVRGNLASLVRWQHLPSEDLLQVQQGMLREVLLHAYRSTDYYRRILGAGGVIGTDDSVQLNRFGSLPFLDKSLLRREFENLRSADLARRRWFEKTSGGSTGETARFVQDFEYEGWTEALKMLFDEWSGYRPSDRRVVLWGSLRDVDGSVQPWLGRAGGWLRGELRLRAFRLSERDLIEHAYAINAYRPVQLLSYVESAYELSRVAERHGIKLYSPRSVMTSAGTLFPAMRETIERVFGAPVFDKYGSTEVGDIASECDHHRGLHVCSPTHYVEILRSDGQPVDPGEEGEIVVTNLVNHAMPLIRYRIGDTGVWATDLCDCGRTWPLLARVSGRISNTFLNRRGDQVDGTYFVFVLDPLDWVQRFRVIQEAVDRIDVYLQPAHEPSQDEIRGLEEVESLIRLAMGGECSVNFMMVPEIEPLPSGKHLYTISKVRVGEDKAAILPQPRPVGA